MTKPSVGWLKETEETLQGFATLPEGWAKMSPSRQHDLTPLKNTCMADDDYSDAPTIPDDAELCGRMPPWHFVHDENWGQIRPSSAAFENHPDGSPISVLLAAEAGDPHNAFAGHQGFALASRWITPPPRS